MKIIIFLFLLLPIFANAEIYSEESIGIMRNIKCPICNGQSIYDSNNEISKEMRKMVVQLVNQHKSTKEINKLFKEKFGNDIIINRTEPSIIYVIYLIPLIMMLLLIYLIFRKRRI